MKRWNRTVFDWACSHLDGWKTNIPVDDWHKPEEKHFHGLHRLRIISQPNNRIAMAEVVVQRVAISPSTRRKEIIEKLRGAEPLRSTRVLEEDFCSIFQLELSLFRGEHFSDAAINIAKAICQVLGIQHKSKHSFASFVVYQETLVYKNEEWISFADYLRDKYGLPRGIHYRYLARTEGNFLMYNYQPRQ
jgi:hypothetical protein